MKTFIYTLSAFVLVLSPATCTLDQNNYGDSNTITQTVNSATEAVPTVTITTGAEIDPPIPAQLPTKP